MDELPLERKPLVRAYQELNAGFVDLIGALSVLRALSMLSVDGLSEQELMVKVLQVLVLNQDLERCSVYLLQDGVLVNQAGLDWADLIGLPEQEPATPRRFALGEGLVGLAAQTGKLQHCRNCTTDPRFVGVSGERRMGSIIAAPISANGESIGVLNVSHPHSEFFTSGHERTLQVFTNFLGQMIVNRRLLARMDRLVSERTEQLELALAEAEALKRRYAELSVVDELTGLHNRRYFFPEAHAAMSRAIRSAGAFSLLLMDVDHFKQVNDTYGHAAGDEVLRQFASLLHRECRAGDVLARFGGEEFIVALPDTDLEGARMLSERILQAVRERTWLTEGHVIRVSVSMGLAFLAPGAATGSKPEPVLDHMLRQADHALYFGKHNGRDRCCYYFDIACDLDSDI